MPAAQRRRSPGGRGVDEPARRRAAGRAGPAAPSGAAGSSRGPSGSGRGPRPCAAPVTMTRIAGAASRMTGLKVTRGRCGSTWVGRRDRQRQLGRADGRAAREDRQEVAVRARSRAGRGRRPAGPPDRAGPRRAASAAYVGRTPVGTAIVGDRLAGGPGMDVVDRERARRGRLVEEDLVDARGRSRGDGRGARSDRRPTTGGPRAHGTARAAAGGSGGRRGRPGSSRRSWPGRPGRAAATAAIRMLGDPLGRGVGERVGVGQDLDGGLAQSARSSPGPPLAHASAAAIRAAIRTASSATWSRPPASIASASRSTSVRRAALKRAVEDLDAVLPGPHADRLGLGGHVHPQLRAAPLAQELDPQRRARPASPRGPAGSRPRLSELPWREGGGVAPAGRRLDARAAGVERRRAPGRSGLATVRPRREASQATW